MVKSFWTNNILVKIEILWYLWGATFDPIFKQLPDCGRSLSEKRIPQNPLVHQFPYTAIKRASIHHLPVFHSLNDR